MISRRSSFHSDTSLPQKDLLEQASTRLDQSSTQQPLKGVLGPSHKPTSSPASEPSLPWHKSLFLRLLKTVVKLVFGSSRSLHSRRHVTFAKLPIVPRSTANTWDTSRFVNYAYATLLFITLRSAWLHRLTRVVRTAMLDLLQRTARSRLV
jgi:hypothetical protein